MGNGARSDHSGAVDDDEGIMMFSRFPAAFAAVAVLAATLTTVSSAANPAPASADTNPSTSSLTSTCDATPAFSTGTAVGVPAVAPGELVRIESSLTLDAGQAYQDVVARPDGSTYFASVIELDPSTAPGAVFDPSSAAFTVNGGPTPFTNGTQPSVDGYVLDTSGGRLRLYFPGDAASMLANVAGAGLPSIVVDSNGTVFELSANATVGTGPTVTSGATIDLATCRASMSTGPSARTTGDRLAKVGVAEPNITIKKSVTPATVSAGAFASFSITVTNAQSTPDSPTGPAFDIAVVDTLPAELIPVNASGVALADGDTNSSGLRWNGTERTLTTSISRLEPGADKQLTVRVKLADGAAAASTYTNNVDAVATSLPGSDEPERSYPRVASSAALNSAAAAPTITKTADRDSVVLGNVVNYTVTVSLPSNSHYENITLLDVLPPAMYYQWNPQASCAGCTSGPSVSQDLGADNPTSTTTRIGYYLGAIDTGAAPATITWTYSTWVNSTFSDGAKVPQGHVFTNTAEFRANVVDRFGGVSPRLNTLRPSDFRATATDDVVAGQPDLAIVKRLVGASPLDPSDGGTTWEVTLTNTGPVAASNVYVYDSEDSASPSLYTGQLVMLSPAEDFFLVNNGVIGVRAVPANGSYTFRYSIPWYPTGWYGASPEDYSVINRATIQQFSDPYGVGVSPGPNSTSTAEVQLLRPDLKLTKERLTPATVAVGTPVEYRVTITNDGLGSATNVVISDRLPTDFGPLSMLSSTPAGVVDCSGSSTISCSVTPNRIAPGASITFDYRVETDAASAGRASNEVTLTYTDGANRPGYTDASGVHQYTAQDAVDVTLVAPKLTLAKTPELDDPGATIDVGGSSTFYMVATNTGSYFATDVEISDPMPAHLSADLANATCVIFPASPTSTCTISGASNHPRFVVDKLAPGAEMRVQLPVGHDGSDPKVVGSEFENTASLSALGFTTISDEGGLNAQAGPKPPRPVKTVSPTSAGPGDTVTYTVDVDLQNANATVYDATVVDTVPDGLTNITPGSITCTAGSCPTTLGYIGFEASANGGGRAAWFIGDQPLNTTGTVRIVYTAQVAEAFVGGGIPVAGTLVRDGVPGGDPLKNAARVWFNDGVDRYLVAPGAVPATTTSQFTNRSVNTRATLDIASPLLVIAKSAAERSLEAGDRSNPLSVETYTLTVTNNGSRSAYAVDVVDNMANGELRDVQVDALPAGVAVTDDWTLADPATSFRIAQVAPGETVTITYTAVPRTSAQVLDSRYNVINSAFIAASHSTPGGSGIGDYAYPASDPVTTTVYVYTPQPRVGASACSDPDQIGEQVWFSVNTANYHWQGTPDRADVGTLFDGVLTVRLDPSVLFVAGSVLGTEFGESEQPYRDPDTLVVNADMSTTMTWNVGDVPINNGSAALALRWKVNATQVAIGGLIATLSGVDSSGAPARGSQVGATTAYSESGGSTCTTNRTLQKTPDIGTIRAGQQLTWNASFAISTSYRHAQTESGEFVDILPLGFVYTPFTATFSDGRSAASHNETIVTLPDGRTQITWTDFTVTAQPESSQSISVSIPTRTVDEASLTAEGPLPRAFVNHIGFTAPGSAAITGSCNGLANAMCDTGTITVESNNQPTVSKSVDHPLGPWGDTARFTIDVSIPKNYSTGGLFARDLATIVNNATPYWPAAQPSLTFAPISASCVLGCTPGGSDDITVTALPQANVGYSLAVAWKTGAIASDSEPRTLRLEYAVQTPTIDEIAALSGCVTYGMSAEGYYGCGKGTFRNTVDLYSTYSSLAGVGSNWWNTFYNYGISYLGSASADFTASVPDVRIVKACGKPGEAPEHRPDSNMPTDLEQSALGVANVACTVTVVNDGPGPAYYIEFNDKPAPNSAYGWQTTWDIRSNVSPAPANVDTAPADGSAIAWTLPELAEGASYSASFEARASLPGWASGIQVSTSSNFGTRFSNTARITSYDPDDFGSIHIADTGNWWSNWNSVRKNSTTWLDVTTPRVSFAKQVNSAGGADRAHDTDPESCQVWQQLLVGSHSLCWGANDRYYLESDEPLDYHLNVMVSRGEQLRTADLTDTLPLGWSYVPGSARLEHVMWDATGNPVTTTTPLFDPAMTPPSSTTCAWWNGTGGGEQLQWVFSRAATDQANALWDDAMRWTGPTAAPGAQFDATYRISFTAAPNALWVDCKELSTPGWDPTGPLVQNQARLAVTSTSDSSATLNAEVSARGLTPPRFVKSPESGFVTADGDAIFTLDTENVQKFSIDDVTVTDTIQDWSVAAGAPLYEPGSATVTDEFGDPVAATENVLHRSTGPGDPSIISWTFDQRPAYSSGAEPRVVNDQCPVSATPDRPYWNECASRVRISVSLPVPADEEDGYQFANDASAEFPERLYDLPGNYAAMGPFTYGATLTDSGRYTVINPSPPPTPSKWGQYWATPNDEVSYWIQLTVPAGTTYHDLAYTDVLPDGLNDVRISNVRATLPDGSTAPFPQSTTIGPVVDPADHSTAISVYFGDVPGIQQDRSLSFTVSATIADRYADGARVVDGDIFTDTVTGYANETDVDSTVPSAPVTSAEYISEPSTATSVIDEPDVRIEKTADRPGPLAAGDQVNYTVRVTNSSSVNAYRIPVEDHPNAALTDVQLTGDTSLATKGWSTDDPALAWEIPVLYGNQTREFTYRATVAPDPQTAPAIVNTASVGTYQARQEVDADNREYDGPSATHTIRFLSADLRIAKVPNPTGASPCPADDPSNDEQTTSVGRATPWCVTVTNAGELTAGEVVANDLLPASWDYVAGSSTVGGVAVEPTVTTIFGLTLLRWDIGDMVAGASSEIRYEATPEQGSATTVRNTAWAEAQRPDGSAPPAGAPGFRATDSASASLATVGVEIAKTPDRQMLPLAPAGGRADWTITVTNPAATDLTNVVVTDHFPAGVAYVAAATTSTCAGSTEAADAANANGQFVRWTFPLLAVGESCSITVSADVPAGVSALTTYVNDAEVVSDQTPVAAANQAKLVVYEPASVGDRVWHDLNANGIQDAGEPGYNAVGVRVDGTDIEGNPVSSTTVTDADGRWTISVAPGTYQVTVDTTTVLSSADRTTPFVGSDPAVDSDVGYDGTIDPVTIGSGEHNIDLDAGYIEYTASLSGRRWHDTNGNGIQDAGEAPIAGVPVKLSGCGTAGGCGELSTVTDGDGYYEFLGLPPAYGSITFDDDPTTFVSSANQGTDDAVDSDADPATRTIQWTINSGQHLPNLDEGTYEGVSVTGFAWSDVDRDGVQGASEHPKADVTVTLIGTAGDGSSIERTASTESDGTVTFEGLPPGTYALRYGTTETDRLTGVDVGGDDAVDSDADPSTGVTRALGALSGGSVHPGDAGFWAPTNVAVTKRVVGGPSVTGEVTYRLRVTNTGDLATVDELTLVDDLPDGLTAVSADGGSWTCEVSDSLLTCVTPDSLAAGEYHDVTLVAQIAAGWTGAIVNVATVRTLDEADNSTTVDDVDTASVTLERPATTTTTSTVTSTVSSTAPSSTSVPSAETPESPGELAFTGRDAVPLSAIALGGIVLGFLVIRLRRDRGTRLS